MAAGLDREAVDLMNSHSQRSWQHMIDAGSTMTWEAWDATVKPNLTWNHAWGAAPANILSRFVLGVRPLEPGFAKILIAPQPGDLAWVKGKVPTIKGPVEVSIKNGKTYHLEVTIPEDAKAEVRLPLKHDKVYHLDGNVVNLVLKQDETPPFISMEISGGKHSIVCSPAEKN